MENELVIEELINFNLYKNLYNELENLPIEKQNAAGVREELSNKMALASSKKKDAAATIMAFYYYSLGKQELNFLQDYYHKMFSSFFNKKVINQYFYQIVTNQFVFKAVIDLCSKDIVNELYQLCEQQNKNKAVSPTNSERTIKVSKVNTISKEQFSNLERRTALRTLVDDFKLPSVAVCEESGHDKIASANREIITSISETASNIKGTFLSVLQLPQDMLSKVKAELKEIYESYKEETSLRKDKLTIVGGTKVATYENQKTSVTKVA